MHKRIILETTAVEQDGDSGIKRIVKAFMHGLSSNGWTVTPIAYRQRSRLVGKIRGFWYFNVHLREYLGKSLAKEKSLFVVPNNMSKFIRLPHEKSIFLIHDLIPLDHRIGYSGIRLLIYKHKISLLKSAKGCLTVSHYVAKQLTNSLGLPAEKIRVVYDVLDPIFSTRDCSVSRQFEEKVSRFGPYILAVGTGEPRKNLDVVLNNLRQVYERYRFKLILFGGDWQGEGHRSVYRKIRQLDLDNIILHLRRVDDDELKYLYQKCQLFIYPSLAEGFGLPPLEAMSQGAKIILSDLEVFREIYGATATYIDPENTGDLILKIGQALEKESNISAIQELLNRYDVKTYGRNLNDAVLGFMHGVE